MPTKTTGRYKTQSVRTAKKRTPNVSARVGRQLSEAERLQMNLSTLKNHPGQYVVNAIRTGIAESRTPRKKKR